MTHHIEPLGKIKEQKKRKLLPVLSLVTLAGVAIASPTAAAAHALPSDSAGALAIIIPIAILLSTLVFAVWKQTFEKAAPMPAQFARAHARAPRSRK